MQVQSTSDVPLELLRPIVAELPEEVAATVADTQHFFKSVEPPSWILFIAEADWWLKAIAAYGALYVAEIVKSAAKDTWRSKAKAAAVVQNVAANALRTLAKVVSQVRTVGSARTNVRIGLPVPDEYWGASLTLDASSQELIELQLALFVHHLSALVELMAAEGLSESGAGPLRLALLESGDLEVEWQDSATFEHHKRVLPFDAA